MEEPNHAEPGSAILSGSPAGKGAGPPAETSAMSCRSRPPPRRPSSGTVRLPTGRLRRRKLSGLAAYCGRLRSTMRRLPILVRTNCLQLLASIDLCALGADLIQICLSRAETEVSPHVRQDCSSTRLQLINRKGAVDSWPWHIALVFCCLGSASPELSCVAHRVEPLMALLHTRMQLP